MHIEERALLVPVNSDQTFDVIRDAIADLALPLNRLEHRRHHVEELFATPAPTTVPAPTPQDVPAAEPRP